MPWSSDRCRLDAPLLLRRSWQRWGVFLSAASIPINLLNAATFATATSDQLGAAVLVKHFIASLAATMTASVFIFSAIVTIRSTVALIGGPRLTSALGPFPPV